MFKFEAESECSIPTDFQDYSPVAYQFRTNATDVLIKSQAAGAQIGSDFIMWGINHGGGMHDLDRCLKGIHDMPDHYSAVAEATKALLHDGY